MNLEDGMDLTIEDEVFERKTLTCRVNAALVDILKGSETPLTPLMESLLVYYLTLDDEEKLKMIANNAVDQMGMSDLRSPINFSDMVIEKGEEFGIPGNVLKVLSMKGRINVVGKVLSYVKRKNEN